MSGTGKTASVERVLAVQAAEQDLQRAHALLYEEERSRTFDPLRPVRIRQYRAAMHVATANLAHQKQKLFSSLYSE